MVRMRMVIPEDLQLARSRVLFHPQLLQRIDQEPIALRFPAWFIKRQDCLGPLRVMPQISQWNNFTDSLFLTVGNAEKHSTALVWVVLVPVPLDCFQMAWQNN